MGEGPRMRPVAFARQEDVATLAATVDQLTARLAVFERALEAVFADVDMLIQVLIQARTDDALTDDRDDEAVAAERAADRRAAMGGPELEADDAVWPAPQDYEEGAGAGA